MLAARPLLYTYRRCPYAMRARMALLVAGVTFDAYEIVLGNKPTALLEASPKATVPVLVLPDGQVIEQSWDIVRWSLTQPDATLSAHGWWHRAETKSHRDLILINDGPFKFHLDRYKYPERFSAVGHDGLHGTREHHRDRAVETLLQDIESRLAEAHFLGGHHPCATDIGIFPFVRQFAAVDPNWFSATPLPRLKAWLAHWQQSPLFEACMQKLPSNLLVAFHLQHDQPMASPASGVLQAPGSI